MSIVVKAKAKILNGILSRSTIVPRTINASLSSCEPVTIESPAGTTIDSVPSGGTYVVPPVTIYDQDENPIDIVAAGGTYTVLLFSGIDGGEPGTTFTNSIVGGTP